MCSSLNYHRVGRLCQLWQFSLNPSLMPCRGILRESFYVISHFYLDEILETKKSLAVKVGLQGFRAQGLRGMLTWNTLMICQFTTGNQINLSETFTFHLPKGQDVGRIIVGKSAIPQKLWKFSLKTLTCTQRGSLEEVLLYNQQILPSWNAGIQTITRCQSWHAKEFGYRVLRACVALQLNSLQFRGLWKIVEIESKSLTYT
jgi:hypothetical protein